MVRCMIPLGTLVDKERPSARQGQLLVEGEQTRITVTSHKTLVNFGHPGTMQEHTGNHCTVRLGHSSACVMTRSAKQRAEFLMAGMSSTITNFMHRLSLLVRKERVCWQQQILHTEGPEGIIQDGIMHS